MKALIVFLKSPRPGAVKTRLGAVIGMDRAASVYREIAGRILQEVILLAKEDVEPLLFVAPGSDPDEVRSWAGGSAEVLLQEGESLGVRMEHAFATAFVRGARRGVIVGTDVPGLHADLIRRAFRDLEHHDLVLGPATDGGYYLLGMKPPVKDVFGGIRWSSPGVAAETRERAARAGLKVALLPPLSDIDTFEDYQAWQSRRSGP